LRILHRPFIFMRLPEHVIIFEDSSLELVPAAYLKHESCRLVEEKFGVPPRSQILDDNFHHKLLLKLKDREKRGRPDIVHLALLDVTSTPAYYRNFVSSVVHTVNGQSIIIKEGVRLPRTLQRFCGVMSKVLSNKLSEEEKRLFSFDNSNLTFGDLVEALDLSRIICLTTEGVPKALREVVARSAGRGNGRTGWIIGGFARGHFKEEVKSIANEIISISEFSLAAHVVSARLCYEIELSRS
jgi:rRNA small subunit pseudouridine methyltransferase Nep1